MVYDACRVRMIEIGESVQHLSPELLANAPATPWREIVRLRDRLVLVHFAGTWWRIEAGYVYSM
ncbi:HepT-like ribonuclease domain-containing protein [Ferrimicrobium acidiphilum]|uniref:HepT-like ribonuclease domain-containing protein n=1 Tax=Ferrimicrobium acidiphilum TaxID=121039 RepID=UPI0023F4FC21|nr:HepT-like ribonuclease domain-containing protein [Ferrimicrobium acidiphilum]